VRQRSQRLLVQLRKRHQERRHHDKQQRCIKDGHRHGQHSSYGDSVLSVQVAYPAVRKGTRHARSTPIFIILPPHIPEDAITVEIIDYGKRGKGRRSKRRRPPPPWLSQGVVEQQEWYHLRSLRPALAGVFISFLFHSRGFLPLWVYLPLMALLIWTAFFTNRN